MRQGELEEMPEPAALRLLAADGQVLVTHGRTLVYRYEADDTYPFRGVLDRVG